MKKKILLKAAIATSAIIPVASIVSCGSKSLNFDETKKDSLVMIVGSTGHNDKGFLQGSYDGAMEAKKAIGKFKEYGEIKISNSQIPTAKTGTSKGLQSGAYAVLGVGFQYPTFFNNADYAGKYKDRQFIALDGAIDTSKGPIKPNVTAVEFEAEQAAFLSGVASGIYLAKNFDDYKKDGLRVGVFGGSAYPPIKNMISGFMQGVAYYNTNLAIDNKRKVEIIGWNGQENGFTGGFTPDAKSVSTSKTLLSKKADVIFPVAGGQVNSLVDAIKGEAGSKTKIVGVDSDQSVVFGSDGDLFITSALKSTKTATLESLKAIFGDSNAKIKVGKNNKVGLDGGFVGLAKGVFDGKEYKGTDFPSIIKPKAGINFSSSDSIWKQITADTNKIYKDAQEINIDWNKKAKSIFGASSNTKVEIIDFKS